MKHTIPSFILFILLFAAPTLAQVGGGGGENCKVTNVPSGAVVHQSGTGINLKTVGVACTTLVNAYVTASDREIASFSMVFSSNVNFDGSAFGRNANTNKVLAHFGSSTGVTSFTIEVPYPTTATATRVHICEGTTALAQIAENCNANGYKGYTYDIGSSNAQIGTDEAGNRVIEVSVSGTGAVLLDEPFRTGGSGATDIEDVDAYLKVPVTYTTREKLTHTIYYQGTGYSLTTISIDLKSTSATLSFTDQNILFILEDETKKHVDITQDGKPDITITATKIRYPEITLTITPYTTQELTTLPTQQDTEETLKYTRPGEQQRIFSALFSERTSLSVKIITWSVISLLVLLFVLFILKQYLGTILKGL